MGSDSLSQIELMGALNRLQVRPGQVGEFNSFHMSTKKGPQGQAIMSSLTELTLLPHELLNKIILVGGNKLGNSILENLDRLDILGDLT
jgi:hypothetical protein